MQNYSIESFIDIAWSVSPEIAIHMGSRFPSPHVQSILQRFVLARTSEVVKIPEAVKYLLTEQNVSNNVPQLKWLLYWDKCEAKDALKVLSLFFAHVSHLT